MISLTVSIAVFCSGFFGLLGLWIGWKECDNRWMEKMALKLKAEHSKEKFIKNMVDELGRDVTVVKNKYIPENTIIVGTETYEGFNKAFNPEKLIKENEDVIKKSGFKSWTFTNGTVSGTVDGGCCS